MNYITTTDLRTQSPELIAQLKKGSKVTLIHRSTIIGVITPVQTTSRLFDASTFKKVIGNGLSISKDEKERTKTYEKHLKDKYGKHLS
jgi:antitoxin (DNA-binding transcriptional repressor) of toxin-antitoxin stability system